MEDREGLPVPEMTPQDELVSNLKGAIDESHGKFEEGWNLPLHDLLAGYGIVEDPFNMTEEEKEFAFGALQEVLGIDATNLSEGDILDKFRDIFTKSDVFHYRTDINGIVLEVKKYDDPKEDFPDTDIAIVRRSVPLLEDKSKNQ